MLLQRGNHVRDELDWHDQTGAHRCADDVLDLCVANVFFGQGLNFAERQREIKGRVRDRTEIGIGS